MDDGYAPANEVWVDGVQGFTPTATTSRPGYEVKKWSFDSEGKNSYTANAAIDADCQLFATWGPRSDTAYRVEHYQQDVAGSGYTLRDTDQLTGTTDATATATAKTYTGYHELTTHADRVPSGSITPDGSTVLRLYYDRNLYSVTFDSMGGSNIATQTDIRFGDKATQPTPPVKQGYTFYGWCEDKPPSTTFSFSEPITGDKTLYAYWVPRNDTPWSLQHYLQNVNDNGYTLSNTLYGKGETGAIISVGKVPDYPGFAENTTHADRIPSGSIAPDGSTVLRLYYDRDLYSVTFDSKGGSSVAAQTGIRFEATATVPTPPNKTGYDFGGWWADEGCTVAVDFAAPITGDVTVYASWTARSDTAYKVEHYAQDVTGAGYTLRDTDQLTGTTDATATATAKTYTGFHELDSHTDRVPSGSVAPDGSTVLRLYYDRDLHSVTFDANGGSSVAAQTGIRFEATATVPTPPSKTGYDFGGWWADVGCTVAFDFTAPITGDVTVYASWTARSDTTYRVEHYQQDVTGAGYTLRDTDQLTGTTDATVTATAKTYTGFAEHTTHADRVPSGKVAPDGSTVLRLYYDRDTYTVDFDLNGAESTIPGIQVTYGYTYGTLPVPGREGFIFAGWYTQTDGGSKVLADDVVLTTQSHTLYAHWSKEEFSIVDGGVEDTDGNAVANAKIIIRAGAVDYKTTSTDEKGRFTITNVKYGTYNLVVEKDGKVVTTLLDVRAAQQTQSVVLPIGITNSVVVVSEDVPEIVAGGLDSLFNFEEIYTSADTQVVTAGGKVELRLNIEGVDKEHGQDIISKATKPVDMLLSMVVTKEVTTVGEATPDTTAFLTELPELMTFIIPLDKEQGGKSGYVVYRAHDGSVDEIGEEPNEAGEHIIIQDEQLLLYARKFSLYGLAFDVPTSGSPYVITATAGVGGEISPTGKTYVSSGTSKTFTITPGVGHRIADVLVDGKSVGAVDSYKFSRVSAKHTIEAVFYCPSLQYPDLDTESWYHGSTDFVISHGLMLGGADGRFIPAGDVTRGQMAVILARMSGVDSKPMNTEMSFRDVQDGSWYSSSVAWAALEGVGIGYSAETFGPGDPISREQMALMLYRLSDSPGSDRAVLDAYKDGGSVSGWAMDAMAWAVSTGIIVGDGRGNLNPRGKISRVEAAALLQQFIGRRFDLETKD